VTSLHRHFPFETWLCQQMSPDTRGPKLEQGNLFMPGHIGGSPEKVVATLKY